MKYVGWYQYYKNSKMYRCLVTFLHNSYADEKITMTTYEPQDNTIIFLKNWHNKNTNQVPEPKLPIYLEGNSLYTGITT